MRYDDATAEQYDTSSHTRTRVKHHTLGIDGLEMCTEDTHTLMVPLLCLLLEHIGIPLLLLEDLPDSRPHMFVDRFHQSLGQGDEPRLPECGYYTTTP